jgi:hypothetical protein
MGCGASKVQAAPSYRMRTPMLVMPFRQFKAQGRIMKSVQKWRDEALEQGWLIEFSHEPQEGLKVRSDGKVAIFISHTWWDREFVDETNDPDDQYDIGAPDYQTGEKKDLKWRVICAGVSRLIEQEQLKEKDVCLWVDWQSLYQDDRARKHEGVNSLIEYATQCQYMLVPTEDTFLPVSFGPSAIPCYGGRGWW